MSIYLFDFDGTLVDSMPTYGGIMLGLMEEMGMDPPPDILRITTPLGYRGAAEYFKALGAPLSVDQMVEKMQARALDAYTHTVPAKVYVADTVRALRSRGDSLNVLTASPHSALDPCLKRLGLWECFDCIWSCEDFALTKADPEIYRRAARQLQGDVGRILFLDDNLGACRTARAAGMRVCGVYDDSSREYEADIRDTADFYIVDFSQLPSIEW